MVISHFNRCISCIHSRVKTYPEKAVEIGKTAWASRAQGPDKALLKWPATWTSKTGFCNRGTKTAGGHQENPHCSQRGLEAGGRHRFSAARGRGGQEEEIEEDKRGTRRRQEDEEEEEEGERRARGRREEDKRKTRGQEDSQRTDQQQERKGQEEDRTQSPNTHHKPSQSFC